MRIERFCVLMASVAVLSGERAAAQDTARLSISSDGAEAINGGQRPFVSAGGRFVVFTSVSSDLVQGDTNDDMDCFLRDRVLGTTELVSVNLSGGSGNWASFPGVVTPDGRYVAFMSYAYDLVAGDTAPGGNVFVRDRTLGTTECVSLDPAGNQADNYTGDWLSISDDGRYVAFSSRATTLVPGDTNNAEDIFVQDRLTGTTERVSVDSLGNEANQKSEFPAMSSDGRFVVFKSPATNLVTFDTNGKPDIFLHDRQTGVTERVSVADGGVEANDASINQPFLSGDGRFVVFASLATNLVPDDTNGKSDVFVHDRQTHTTERASVATGGAQGNDSTFWGSISRDGLHVGFHSQASNLVASDTNGVEDVFVHDRVTGTTELVSVDAAGIQSNSHSVYASLSADGRLVAFASQGTNLVAGDTNGEYDVFLRDRVLSAPLTSFCIPGRDGVRPCPCSNRPGSGIVGCDNFGPLPVGGTGGARLAATGAPSIAADTVQFQVTSEPTIATNLTLLFQGTSVLSAGAQSGAGVRCVGGTLKRLYKGNASGGSIAFPTGVQPDVHTASANAGFPIVAPTTLFYYAAYRNSAAGTPCGSALLGFNTTSAGSLRWMP